MKKLSDGLAVLAMVTGCEGGVVRAVAFGAALLVVSTAAQAAKTNWLMAQ